MISLLHATRWRPDQARQVRQVWFDQAADASRIEHLFAFDDDDEESRGALSSFPHVLTKPPGSCVAAWNAAAAACRGSVLVQLSDDWYPPKFWDQEIFNRIGNPHESKVLAVSDGKRKDRLLCMAILTRKRYENQGWMFCPEYLGLWSDNEFTLRAYQDAVIVSAPDLVFEHRHALYTPEVLPDRTYLHQNSAERRRQGRETFLRRNPGGLEFFQPDHAGLHRGDAGAILSNLRNKLASKRKAT